MHCFSWRLYRAAWGGTTTAVVLALAWASLLSSVRAQEEPAAPPEPVESAADEQRALTLFATAEDLYREGRFEEAVELLLEARRLHEEPVINYNLARAYEELALPEEAAQAYRRYLELEPAARDRPVIEARIERLERSARPDPSDPAVTPTVAASATPPAARSTPLAPRRAERSSSLVPWLTLSAGAASLGVGVVFGVLSRNSRTDSVEATVNAEAIDAFDRAETFATIANVCFVAGGVLAALGGGWLVYSAASTDGEDGGVALRVGPGGLTLRGAWR